METVEVRRSPRARRWRLEVPWGEPARLTVPRWMSGTEIESVLEERRSWIEQQRRRQVPRLGLERRAVSESEARFAARELTSALAEEEAERLGVTYRRIRIGGQRTLWGSCSARGTLSFNWRLVLAPPRGARLRGRARALPPARPRPLAPLLGARRTTPARLARAARLAPRARSGAARLQGGGVGPYPFAPVARCRRREALSRVASAPARVDCNGALELDDVPPPRPLELRNPRKPA